MSPDSLPDERREAVFLTVVRGYVLFVLLQLGAYALFSPVANWDSYTYHLFRLLLMEKEGLFTLRNWNFEPQLYMPLTFDAIHYPLLKLGFGYGLPSYLCLAGILAAAWTVLRGTAGLRVAWLGVFLLLCLPQFLFQGVSTKNDLALVFGAVCWFYSLYRYEKEPRAVYLVLCALALAFTTGIKSTSLALLALLAPATVWRLKADWRRAGLFLACLALFLPLWGSLETYLNNRRVFGHLLGPQDILAYHRNNDGLRGALASLVRVFFENVFYLPTSLDGPALHEFWQNACRRALAALHLKDLGYALLHHRSDADLFFYFYSPEDTGSAYELAGPVLLCFSLAGFFVRGSRAIKPLLAAGWLWLLIIVWGTGWQGFGTNRYVLLSFALFALAFALWLKERSFPARVFAAGCLALNMFVFLQEALPPAGLRARLTGEGRHTRYAPALHGRIAGLHREAPGTPWFLVGDWNVPLFSFPYRQPEIDWRYLREPADIAGRVPAGVDEAYVVVSTAKSSRDNKVDGLKQVYDRTQRLARLQEVDTAFTLVGKGYDYFDTRILRWRRPAGIMK